MVRPSASRSPLHSRPYQLCLVARECRLSEKNAHLVGQHGLQYTRTGVFGQCHGHSLFFSQHCPIDGGIAITALPLALLPFEDSDSSTCGLPLTHPLSVSDQHVVGECSARPQSSSSSSSRRCLLNRHVPGTFPRSFKTFSIRGASLHGLAHLTC